MKFIFILLLFKFNLHLPTWGQFDYNIRCFINTGTKKIGKYLCNFAFLKIYLLIFLTLKRIFKPSF
jgi:anaerobic C4-dicarboxylate transporter